MKFKLLIIAFFASMMFVACDDTPEAVADFSATTPVYVELSSKAVLAAKQGTTVAVPIRLREGQQQDVIVSYDVTGAFTTSGTATIARNSLTGSISIAIPANVVPILSTTADAVVTLKSATMAGQSLRVGYLDPAAEKRTIRISK
jgi:hypothetical protein